MNDDRAVWRQGDLCWVDGHGTEVFEVVNIDRLVETGKLTPA